MSIDLLELSDLSETGLGTNLAKTLREVGRAAGVVGSNKDEIPDETSVERRGNDRPLVNMGSTPAPIFDISMPIFTAGNTSSLDDFFQSQNELDLSYLLGLSREGDGALLQSGGNWGNGTPGNGTLNEFGFAMGGLGSGVSTSNWNESLDGLGGVFGFSQDSHGHE